MLGPGGELFDHILAHKYLKERDACRLFAQLISGVSYLHQKKIVHRDLKLENLLLDRNRNVIITDFGFANNFEDRRDDLMATSCGSPCYAAPELVVQDGLYAGSAVDVWSCGVILYAMLAGYLPFDDDPANPDGDNINLLYKYIMATPLSFPDYISAEPRDLLSRMLVPDPLKRADLEAVMAHSWLSPYRDLFKFSVEDLERAAVEQQTKKRQVYRQQMQYQAQIQEQQRLQQQQQLARSQSTRSGVVLPPVLGNTTPLGPQTTKSQRHQSAMAASTTVPDRIYDSMAGMPASTRSARHATAVPTSETPAEAAIPAIPLSRPPREPSSGAADPVMAQGDARGEPRSRLDDSLPPSSSPASRKRDAAAREAEAAASAKSKKSQNRQRHTIQLEYEEPSRKKETATRAPALPPVPTVEKKSAKSPAPVQAVAPAQDEAPVQPLQPVSVPAVPIVAPEAERVTKTESEVPQVAAAAAATHGIAVPNGMPSPVAEQVTPVIDTIERPKQEEAQISSPAQPSKDDSAAMRPLPETRPPTTQSSPARPTPSRYVSNPLPPPPGTSRENLPFPHPSGDRVVSTPETKSRKTRPSTAQATPVAVKGTPDKPSSRHRKGLSTDKFFFSRLLGNTPATDPSSDPEKVAVPSITGAGAISELPNGRTFAKGRLGSDVASDIRRQESAGKSSGRRKAMSLVVGRLADQSPATREREKANAVSAAKTAKEERRLTGRPRRDTSGTATPAAGSSLLSPETPKQTNVSLPDASPAPSSVASSSLRQQTSVSSRPATGSVRNPGLFQDGANDSTSTVGPSSNAAKKVMDWFRKKSLSRGTFTEPAPLGPFELTVADRNGSVIDGSSLRHDDESNPRVVVTGAGTEDTGPSSVPSSRSTSGTHSQTSQSTAITSATEASNSNSGVKSSASTVQQTTPRASASAMNGLVSAGSAASFHDSKLRFHLGAVDQSALTSRPPPEVFAEVKQALFDMGIDVRKEKDEDFKLDCVRRKKAKTLMGATTGLGLSIRTSVFPPSQADFERSSRMPASPTSPTPSGPGGSIRNFLRRGSAQAGVPGMASPPSGSVSLPPSATSSTFDAASPNQPSQSLAAQQAQRPSPLYGDASVDGGQEIRFSVEVTKINNLPGLYSLDIRRMKGNLCKC